MRSFVRYALLVLALVLSASSLIPLVPTEWWWVRLLDFPRLPFALGLLAVSLGLLFFLRESPRSTALTLALAAVALTVDAWVLRPYLPTGGLSVDACPAERRLSVMVANVRLGNREARSLVEAVGRVEPDLFLAMETDAWWDQALKPVLVAMPHALQRITGRITASTCTPGCLW